jgi:hypothetical protein
MQRTLDELRSRVADLRKREGRLNAIKSQYAIELIGLIKELAERSFGPAGTPITFRDAAGTIRRGVIDRFAESFFRSEPICIIRIKGDFVSYEAQISLPEQVMSREPL